MSQVSNSSEFGLAIRVARKERGLSQVELAQRAGCSQRFVSELERGKVTAELGKALDVVQASGLTLVLQPAYQTGQGRRLVEESLEDLERELQEENRRRRPKLLDYLEG